MEIKRRRRFKQITSLTERLHKFADQARADARGLPEGEARDRAIERVDVAEHAIAMEGWLTSPGLEPPK